MNQTEWEQSVEWVGVVAACVVKRDGKYLMVQEKQLKAYGLWNLPAGHVDKAEDIEHAAVREAKEETGYDVKIIKELAIYHERTGTPVKHVYMAEIVGGELKAQEDEILDVKWLTYDEISDLNDSQKLRTAWIWDVLTIVEKSA